MKRINCFAAEKKGQMYDKKYKKRKKIIMIKQLKKYADGMCDSFLMNKMKNRSE